MSNKKIALGKITSAHGIKGLFNLNLYNKDSINLNNYSGKVFLRKHPIDLRVKFYKKYSIICESKLFKQRNDVEEVIGEEVWINENCLDKQDFNEFFHKDIIGCDVYDFNLKVLGKVKAVHNFGAGDLLELDNNFKYMIRLYDLNKKRDINLKEKKITLNAYYEF